MKKHKAAARYDGLLQSKFRELDPDRQDQFRYYAHIRLEELLLEQREESPKRNRIKAW